jgi:hypothetical protein
MGAYNKYICPTDGWEERVVMANRNNAGFGDRRRGERRESGMSWVMGKQVVNGTGKRRCRLGAIVGGGGISWYHNV